MVLFRVAELTELAAPAAFEVESCLTANNHQEFVERFDRVVRRL